MTSEHENDGHADRGPAETGRHIGREREERFVGRDRQLSAGTEGQPDESGAGHNQLRG